MLPTNICTVQNASRSASFWVTGLANDLELTLAEHACMPRGAAAAEVTLARRGRPAGHSGDLGHHFPPNPPRGRSGRYLVSNHLGIPERNNVIYRGCASPPQTDALSLAVRRVSVCFPSSKIRCTGSGVFDGHHGPMARAAGAVPGANGRTYCDHGSDRIIYMLSTEYPKIFISLCLVKKIIARF